MYWSYLARNSLSQKDRSAMRWQSLYVCSVLKIEINPAVRIDPFAQCEVFVRTELTVGHFCYYLSHNLHRELYP